MVYTTTKLQQLKSFATYQFHTLVKSDGLESADIFKICILETFRWLRGRLSEYKNLPSEIVLPEPEEFDRLTFDMLHSFIINSGVVIDVVYIEKKGLWSFCLTEPDMGANKGTPEERPAVNGRTFSTEISFILGKKEVEAGFKIICAEPAECTQPCEGFRPSLVRALAENEKLFFDCEGFRIDEKPIVIKNKNAYSLFESLWTKEKFDLPFVFIAEGPNPEEEEKKPDFDEIPKFPDLISPINSFMDKSFKNLSSPLSITYQNEKMAKYADNTRIKNKKSSANEKAEQPKEVKKKERLQTVDYEGLAKSFVTQAIVVYVEGKYYRNLQEKHGVKLSDGDILVMRKGRELLSFVWPEYGDDLKAMERKLKNEVRALSKHQNYWFGNIGRHSDAKLWEVQIRRSVTGTYETELESLREENRILSEKINEMSQQESDRNNLMDDLQNVRKELKSSEAKLKESEGREEKLSVQIQNYENVIKKANDIAKFYDEQWKEAAGFPTEIDKVCGWIRKRFSDTLYVTKRAESACNKYDGAISISNLCDGIVYLDAYARYKLRKIDEETLSLYAARNTWSPCGCGKETLKMRKDDYNVSYEGKTGILDLHIKSGVSSSELLRIYFLWDDELKKVVIGYMPGHLATKKKGT